MEMANEKYAKHNKISEGENKRTAKKLQHQKRRRGVKGSERVRQCFHGEETGARVASVVDNDKGLKSPCDSFIHYPSSSSYRSTSYIAIDSHLK